MTERSDIDHLPKFFGDDNTVTQLDAMLSYGLDRRDLEESRSLFSTKWWDYRFIHTGHSIFLFIHHYGKEVEKWRSKFGANQYVTFDNLVHPIWRNPARKSRRKFEQARLTALEPVLIPKATRTSWLRCVMFADAWGIPYDKWIAWGFQYAFESQWQRMPHPTQLYTDQMALYIHNRWNEECANLMHLPSDPKFLAENFVDHKWQIEFQAWLIDTISKRPRPEIALRNYLINEPFVVEAIAREKLGDEIVDRALRV